MIRLGPDLFIAFGFLVVCGAVLCGALGCDGATGPACVTACASAAPPSDCTDTRSVQDARGKVVSSTATPAPGFDLAGCVQACSAASCVAFCGSGR